MAHRTQYRFYIQLYPQGDMSYQKEDIELKYDCDYMRFDNLFCDGKISNIYQESFAERSGVGRIYIPPKNNLAFASKDCKLKLFFKGGNVQGRVRQFIDDYRGVKLEWSDTFRNRYVTLLMTDEPTIAEEKLHGNEPYMVIEVPFTNILGRTFSQSQMTYHIIT